MDEETTCDSCTQNEGGYCLLWDMPLPPGTLPCEDYDYNESWESEDD